MFTGFNEKRESRNEKDNRDSKPSESINENLPSSNSNKNENMSIPLDIQEDIERIILKILYDEQSVQSLKELTEKDLDNPANKRITISEKSINLIIYQMNRDEQIQFTQKEGWKIRI